MFNNVAGPAEPRRAGERGQTTVEYALVLLAAGTIALLIVAWANNNGAIADFFDSVFDRVTALIA